MGFIERNGFRFEPEYSVIYQKGAIHVYNQDEFVDEIKFNFSGDFPQHDQIEEIVQDYCVRNNI